MTEADVDPIAEQVDQEMMETGEDAGIRLHKVDAAQYSGDLSDGGKVGDVTVVPVGESGRLQYDKKRGFLPEPGRPTVRNVWLWNGVPSTIPLAYTPSGKQHDGGRRYLLKRHCTVCNNTGFYGPVCPQCKKNGRELAPSVPAYYIKLEKVPERHQFFGAVDCFVAVCPRRGKYGFVDEPQMRQHAMSRHRMEYRAFMDAQGASTKTEMDAMRQQITALMTAQITGRANGAAAAPKDRAAKARAARAAKKAAGGAALANAGV